MFNTSGMTRMLVRVRSMEELVAFATKEALHKD